MQGVIEGFFGPPWSHEARLQVIRFAGEHGFDTYVYAPKDEPKHRMGWREPYDAREMADFAELGEAGRRAGVRLIFGVSPGLDMRFTDAGDLRALSDKVAQARAAGFSAAMLAFDDIDAELAGADAARFGGEAGTAQAWVANRLLQEQRALGPRFHLLFAPTEYCGVRATPYLAQLRTRLDPRIDVIWTGPEVISPAITAAAAREFEALVGRAPVLWDNYPANDLQPERLHLGPVAGRDPDLPRTVRGVLVNLMRQARASLVPLLTYARYLRDGPGYDPEAALRDAVAEVGGPAAAPLEQLVAFQRASPLGPGPDAEGRRLEGMAQAARGNGRAAEAAAKRLAAELQGLEDLPDALAAATTAGLAEEVAPWSQKLARLAAVAHRALAGGDPSALGAELQVLRADGIDVGGALLTCAERLLSAEPGGGAPGHR